MDKLEDMGRKLDEELKRLRKFVEEDLAPETEKRTAQFLREVSEKLTEAAGWLEAGRAAETPPQEKKTSAGPGALREILSKPQRDTIWQNTPRQNQRPILR